MQTNKMIFRTSLVMVILSLLVLFNYEQANAAQVCTNTCPYIPGLQTPTGFCGVVCTGTPDPVINPNPGATPAPTHRTLLAPLPAPLPPYRGPLTVFKEPAPFKPDINKNYGVEVNVKPTCTAAQAVAQTQSAGITRIGGSIVNKPNPSGADWSTIVKNYNINLANKTLTPAKSKAIDGFIVNATNYLASAVPCLEVTGITEEPVTTTTVSPELGVTKTNLNLQTFQNLVDFLRTSPKYTGNKSVVHTVDTQINANFSHPALSFKTVTDFSYILSEPAVTSDTSRTSLHGDRMTPYAALIGDNWLDFIAMPFQNGVIYSPWLGVLHAVNTTARYANDVVSVSSAREKSTDLMGIWADCEALNKNLVVVRSVSNVIKTAPAFMKHNECSMAIGQYVDGNVLGTVGNMGPDVVVPMSGTPAPIVYYAASKYMTTGPAVSGGSSVATQVTAQIVGQVREMCPFASAHEIRKNMCITSTPIPKTGNLPNDVRNSYVRCGILDPAKLLKITMLSACADLVPAKWVKTTLSGPSNQVVDSSLPPAMYLAAATYCTNSGAYMETDWHGIDTCRDKLGTTYPIVVYQSKIFGFYAYSAYPDGKGYRLQ